EIDAELQKHATFHLKRLSGGEFDRLSGADGILPMELAKHVVERRGQIAWLRDGATIKSKPEFTDVDITALRSARKTLGVNLAYVGVSLPTVNDLPDAATVGAIHEDILNAREIANMSQSGELAPMSFTVENAIARGEAVHVAMKGLITAIERRGSKPWLTEIFDVAYQDAGPEADALRRLHKFLDQTVAGLGPFIELEVEVPDELFSEEGILEEVLSALRRQVAGKAAFTLVS